MVRSKYTDFVELKEAKDALTAYFKQHNLNPQISYFKDPVHGPILRKLVDRLNLERAKVLDGYRARDPRRFKKLVLISEIKRKEKMAKQTKKATKAELDLATEEKAVAKKSKKKEEKKEKKTPSVPTKYDYPLVDGREMTPQEKRKYREKQRKLAKAEAEGESKEKDQPKEEKKPKAKKPKTTPVEEKPISKVKKNPKKSKKVKDED